MLYFPIFTDNILNTWWENDKPKKKKKKKRWSPPTFQNHPALETYWRVEVGYLLFQSRSFSVIGIVSSQGSPYNAKWGLYRGYLYWPVGRWNTNKWHISQTRSRRISKQDNKVSSKNNYYPNIFQYYHKN